MRRLPQPTAGKPATLSERLEQLAAACQKGLLSEAECKAARESLLEKFEVCAIGATLDAAYRRHTGTGSPGFRLAALASRAARRTIQRRRLAGLERQRRFQGPAQPQCGEEAVAEAEGQPQWGEEEAEGQPALPLPPSYTAKSQPLVFSSLNPRLVPQTTEQYATTEIVSTVVIPDHAIPRPIPRCFGQSHS